MWQIVLKKNKNLQNLVFFQKKRNIVPKYPLLFLFLTFWQNFMQEKEHC